MGIEHTLDTPLAEAVRAVRSQSAFARIAGKSQASVYELLRDGKPLWAESVLAVEAATGVPKEALRPDLYPPAVGEAGIRPAVARDDARRGALDTLP